VIYLKQISLHFIIFILTILPYRVYEGKYKETAAFSSMLCTVCTVVSFVRGNICDYVYM
jgi:hypothetical protein